MTSKSRSFIDILHITRINVSVEKSTDFCYNAGYKVIALPCLLALRCIWKCQSARSPRPVKELSLHIARTMCLVLVSLLHGASKMRCYSLNLSSRSKRHEKNYQNIYVRSSLMNKWSLSLFDSSQLLVSLLNVQFHIVNLTP